MLLKNRLRARFRNLRGGLLELRTALKRDVKMNF